MGAGYRTQPEENLLRIKSCRTLPRWDSTTPAGRCRQSTARPCQEVPPDVPGDERKLAVVRGEEVARADNVGSVPLPGSVRGMVKTALNKLTGVSPEMLIDKLGERLAFERTGVRLYEALLAKASVV